jgi:membrane protein implicated in regulation of membrane protease activity
MSLLGLFGKKNALDKEFTPDSVVGKKCIVTEKIDTFAGCGQVKVNGQSWSARGTFDDDVFEIGETLSIVAVEGVRLICIKN